MIYFTQELIDDVITPSLLSVLINPPPPLTDARMRELRIQECRDEIASLEDELERLLAEKL